LLVCHTSEWRCYELSNEGVPQDVDFSPYLIFSCLIPYLYEVLADLNLNDCGKVPTDLGIDNERLLIGTSQKRTVTNGCNLDISKEVSDNLK
jgi:hypothetical protein